MTKEEIENGCGHWDSYTSSNLSDCQKGNLCDKCSAKLEGYESAKKEFVKNIKEDIEYQSKNLTGDFEEDKPLKWRMEGMRHLITQLSPEVKG